MALEKSRVERQTFIGADLCSVKNIRFKLFQTVFCSELKGFTKKQRFFVFYGFVRLIDLRHNSIAFRRNFYELLNWLQHVRAPFQLLNNFIISQLI